MAGETIESTFRDFTTLNVPSSGKHEPRKSEIRNLLNAFLGQQTGANAGALIQTSKASLDALSPAANTMAWVIGDADPDLDGVYQRSGSTWVKRAPLPYSVIPLNNADAGTANAIEVTTAVGIPSAAFGALYILNVTQENTGAVTVSINGAAAKPLISNTGSPLLAGAITAGMALLCVDDGTSIRLLVPGDIDAIIAAAEALVAAAEAIAGSAYTFSTRAAAEGATIPETVEAIRLNGGAALGDGLGGLYVGVGTEPEHDQKFQTTDGAWWEQKSVTIGSDAVQDNLLAIIASGTDVTRANVYPPVPNDNGISNYFNVALAIGSNIHDLDVPARRSTLVGSFNGKAILEWNLVDAFGHDAMSFAEYADRSTALGSETFIWAGITSRQKAIDYKHDYFRQATQPNDPGWDAEFIAPSGTGLRIWDYTAYATQPEDFQNNLAVGRNAGGHLVKGDLNSFGGYQAANRLWEGSENTVFGALGMNLAYFVTQMTVFGARAAPKAGNDDTRLSAFGYRAIENAVATSRATVMGAFVGGSQCTDAEDSVLIGYLAGEDEAADLSSKFIINNNRSNVRAPLLAGDFATGKAGTNVSPDGLKGFWHIKLSDVAGGTPLTTADGLVIERAATTGITILTTAADFGQILFGDAAASNSGGIQYNHATDELQFRVGGQTRATFLAGLRIGAPTGGDKGTGTLNAVAVYDDNVLLTCYPIEAATTGAIDLGAWDKASPNGQHIAARRFAAERMGLIDVDAFVSFWREHGHLPSLPGREEWHDHAKDKLSTGEMVQRLWETVDLLAVHIGQMRDEQRGKA